MEAAPKFPMLSFDLMTCIENVHFGSQLKKYIAAFYGEDPDSYITEINNLEALRAAAVRPTMDVNGVQLLKKYYCQLHFLKSRFPMEENQDAAVQFAWKNPQMDLNHVSSDIRFELMVIMYNIGALHTYLGANDTRNNPEGMKMSCTHFQCAAWAFQTVKETYHQFIMYVSLVELVHFFQQVSLAQAQECILEKSMFDNRKPTIIAKVAVQVYNYYRQSLSILELVGEDYFRDKVYKEWTKFLNFKISYYKCIALLFQGQQSEEQQKMGERVAYYQAACDQLDEAKKHVQTLKNQAQQQEINEGMAFTTDVVEGKRKAAKNENEFIYHEAVPDKDQLQEVKGASLVKGIPFSINDLEVSGPDIFSRLVPMEAHEAASLYSEKMAHMLRQIGELIETKDQTLAEFMSSMHLDLLTKMHQATGIPQELIDRAAALSAKPSAVQDLINAMGKLSNIYQEVEANLNEIDSLLKAEEEAEKQYQEKIGKRPPSILATDLTREAAKYREAHTKANDSNQTLHRAMTAHVANLKILQQPLKQLQLHLPFVELPNPNIDENALKDLESLVAKVEEMRNQRAMLWAQLREAVHKDDITSSLVTKQPNQSLEQLFQQELQKHQQLTQLIEQNTAAQENIKKALVDSYAQAVNTRRYIQDIIQKRSATISSLIASCDSYDDLLSKANKGIEFYTKLETNVSKLLQRIKSTCKVQQEERDQVLGTTEVPKVEESIRTTPKLKDYLDSRKRGLNPDPSLQYQHPSVNYGVTMELPPGVRPTPVGSEVTDAPAGGIKDAGYIQLNYTYQQQDDLVKRMNSLMSQGKDKPHYSHSSYIPQNYTPTTYQMNQNFSSFSQNDLKSPYDPTKAFTTTTNSYRNLQTSTTPGFVHYPDSSTGTGIYQYQQPNMSQTSVSHSSTSQSSLPPSISSSVVPQPALQYSGIPQDVNTYYPQGYAPQQPFVSKNDAQHVSGDVKYHSVEYATSVPQNLTNFNSNFVYSSPLSNMASTNVRETTDYYYGANVYAPSTGASTSANIQDSTGAFSADNYYNYYGTAAGGNVQLYSQAQQNTVPTQNISNNIPVTYHQYYAPVQSSIPSQTSGSTNQYSQAAVSYGYNYYNTPYSSSNQTNYTYTAPTTVPPQPSPSKTSNVDLLSGLDFNISQAPLVPQQNVPVAIPKEVEAKPKEVPVATKSSEPKEVVPEVKRPNVKVLPSKPLNNKDVKALFKQELEKYEKFVETLTIKTLSGPTNLEVKWKEIQDQQDCDSQKKIISVARCYPMKNKFPDILPYDYSRVELCDTKDDYINASYIKDISPYAPPFIVTQIPLSSTVGDFWTMIREQQVELILCLQNDNEIGDDIYWPREKGQSINVLNMVLTLQSVIMKSHCVERLISVNLPEKRESRAVMHLQFTSWPGSLFPTTPDPFVGFVLDSITMYQQQKSNIHPVVVHCSSGIGRSGLLCLLMAAIFDVTNNANSIPDLTLLSIKLSSWRKNILRDREHLKFAFESFLAYVRQVVSEDKVKKKLNDLELPAQNQDIISTVGGVSEKNVDPLSTLDPFWASKK